MYEKSYWQKLLAKCFRGKNRLQYYITPPPQQCIRFYIVFFLIFYSEWVLMEFYSALKITRGNFFINWLAEFIFGVAVRRLRIGKKKKPIWFYSISYAARSNENYICFTYTFRNGANSRWKRRLKRNFLPNC